MRPLVAPAALLALLALSACAGPAPVASAEVCPPPVAYTLAQERQAAAEYDALPAGAELRRFMDDYHAERAALRACRG